MYGKELILDLHYCNSDKFNRIDIEKYFVDLCLLIKMTRCDLHFWDEMDVPPEERQTNPKTKGTSAIQFILTSNVTIHCLDDLNKIFINVFSCDNFDENKASEFTKDFFSGEIANQVTLRRI